MSSHCPFWCASSISFRVGEPRICMHKLEQLRSRVLSTLMTMWSPRLSRLLLSQLPVYILPRPPRLLHLKLNTRVAVRLVTNTIPVITQHVIKRTSLRDHHVRQVLARGLSGSTCGNQGDRNFLDAKRTLNACGQSSGADAPTVVSIDVVLDGTNPSNSRISGSKSSNDDDHEATLGCHECWLCHKSLPLWICVYGGQVRDWPCLTQIVSVLFSSAAHSFIQRSRKYISRNQSIHILRWWQRPN